MKKVRIMEGVMTLRFAEINGQFCKGTLTTEEAAELLGVSVRTFLRKRCRAEEEGFDGVYDRRLGRVSSRRALDSKTQEMCQLYKERYRGFSVKHFHAMAGMMIHQDGSTHRWIPGLDHNIDLIVTMDDATSEVTSAFFVSQEGTLSTFRGIQETIERYGLFCSFYTDRGSHYWYTPEEGGKVDKGCLTEVGRALKHLGIQHIAAYSPQARGRSERMFGTLQDRLPKELELAKIEMMEEANRYLQTVYLSRHNAQFTVKAREEAAAWIPWGGMDLNEILCIQEGRIVQNDNTISYEGVQLQILSDELRHHYVRTTVQVRRYKDGSLGVFYGHRLLGRYDTKGQHIIAQETLTKAA